MRTFSQGTDRWPGQQVPGRGLPDWLIPRACNLPDLLAWSKVASDQDMPHVTQLGPEPAMTRTP